MARVSELELLVPDLEGYARAEFRGERTVDDMVDEARILMRVMHLMTGVDPDPEADGPYTVIGDMLAHLMHLADAEDLDFESVLATAQMHHDAEVIDVYGL